MAHSLLNIKMKARISSMLSNENALENSQLNSKRSNGVNSAKLPNTARLVPIPCLSLSFSPFFSYHLLQMSSEMLKM